MKRLLPLLLLLCCVPQNAASQQVRSLLIREASSSFSPAIMRMNTTDEIHISFDIMTLDSKYLYYSVEHLNADGSRSTLNDNEFLDGFNDNPLDNGRPSFNTFMEYTYFFMTFPNSQVRPKVSGNYRIIIYESGQKEQPLVIAPFAVAEQLITIATDITTRTNVDYNKAHQQLAIRVLCAQYNINNPAAELQVKITQNSRPDNEVTLTNPTTINSREITYQNQQPLIFEGTNEFRRFETVSNRYGGLRIASVSYFRPYYHATIETDTPRASQSYTFDKDQSGRTLIRSLERDDMDVESDYFLTHFTLAGLDPLINGKIYLYGEFTNFRLDEQSRMLYNFQTNAFEKAIPLKQGAYNYMYLFLPNGEKRATAATIEGNHFETVNEYSIRAYHRPFGERYDRLIGTATVYSEW